MWETTFRILRLILLLLVGHKKVLSMYNRKFHLNANFGMSFCIQARMTWLSIPSFTALLPPFLSYSAYILSITFWSPFFVVDKAILEFGIPKTQAISFIKSYSYIRPNLQFLLLRVNPSINHYAKSLSRGNLSIRLRALKQNSSTHSFCSLVNDVLSYLLW